MQAVTVSPKFQVVIPRPIRDRLHIQPGQKKMRILDYEGRVELILERDIADMRGFLKGINTDFTRENDRL
jgi:AbrB family looped-hinge helix DNA binding protein